MTRATRHPLAAGLICLCAAGQVSAQVPVPPREWGAVRTDRFGGTDCPVIGGRYAAVRPERVVQRESGAVDEKAIQNPPTIPMLFMHPRGDGADTTKIEKLRVPANDLAFVIVQSAPGLLEVRRNYVKTMVMTQQFSEAAGDFSCSGGYLVLRPWILDKSVNYIKREGRVTRMEDGALAYHERIENARREMLVFRGASVTHYWYRLTPLTAE